MQPAPRIDGISIPEVVRLGEPIEITVWASNVGQNAAEFGGSLTLSFPEAAAVNIVEAETNNRVIRAEPPGCEFSGSYARVITRESTCRALVVYSPECSASAEAIRYPLAETWFERWEAGVQHRLKVRVQPRAEARSLTVYVRAALISQRYLSDQWCFAAIAPSDATAGGRDQQNFPVLAYRVRIEP